MNPITDEERPRFLADEGFNMDVTVGLRLHYSGIDLLTVQEAGLLHALDPQLLEAARHLDRILLSHDVHTLPDHYYALLSQLSQDEHLPGIRRAFHNSTPSAATNRASLNEQSA